MRSCIVIGVSGYTATGKTSLVIRWAEMCGLQRIDADAVAKELMNTNQKIIDAVDRRFGAVVSSKIDFATLGSIVFADDKELHALNEIVHPLLISELNAMTSRSSLPILLDCALIPLWGDSITVDHSIWIETDRSIRLKRLASRTGLTQLQCEQRIAKQESLFTAPLSSAKWTVVNNNSDMELALKTGIQIIHTCLHKVRNEPC